MPSSLGAGGREYPSPSAPNVNPVPATYRSSTSPPGSGAAAPAVACHTWKITQAIQCRHEIGDPMFALCVRHELLPESVAAFDRLVEQTVASIRAQEPGTLVYVVGEPKDDRASRVFLEIYRDEEAFDRHNSQPYVQRFLAAREPMLRAIRVDFLPDCSGQMPEPIDPQRP
jgi:quinol monooxygenase YgiN